MGNTKNPTVKMKEGGGGGRGGGGRELCRRLQPSQSNIAFQNTKTKSKYPTGQHQVNLFICNHKHIKHGKQISWGEIERASERERERESRAESRRFAEISKREKTDVEMVRALWLMTDV
ncbi:hypothetical protein EUGRSUZ_F02890 [Eucalyptus grandis]|uniref:Uncharacterized protein n=2 Tax=Eucalyptus grandis TaxID=71139 RepID=A0ACC3KKB6_EUCGR|nr:hypothetical protein EUGRSUZ_F02890 [Eucalyptus grandis]